MFNNLNILRIFFEDPQREFNVREIARIARIAPATASKILKGLAKKQVLKQRKERIYTLYRAAIDSELYRDMKIFYNIRKIKESGLIADLDRQYLKPTIILFGSMSNGYDVKDSDIDLVIISESTKDFEKLGKYQKKFGRELQIFAVREINDLRNPHLANNVLSGIVLQGAVKWISKNADQKGI